MSEVRKIIIRTHIHEMLVPHRKLEEFDEDSIQNGGGILGTLFDNELDNGDPVLPSGLPLVNLSLLTRQLVFHITTRFIVPHMTTTQML